MRRPRKLSLSDFELSLADMPQATLDWSSARGVAFALLDCKPAPPN